RTHVMGKDRPQLVILDLTDVGRPPAKCGGHRDAFRAMIVDGVDLLFCNRSEVLSMYQTQDFDAALAQGAAEVEVLVVTDGDNGAHIVSNAGRIHVPAVPTQIVDATGAGDAFAGAFLWGLAEGHRLDLCGRMGNAAASSVIGHIGPRPEADLRALFKDSGLI
ncbi:MAG: adenosine kinase, partial [Octadecabacter sp.]|nr:adenosine kinase [Octadecabacter sp.]